MVEKFGSNLALKVADRIREHGEERKPSLRMSNYGKPLRQLWYELKGFKGEPLPVAAKVKFLFGDVLEELLLFLAHEAGHDVRGSQGEVELDGLKGHIDAVIDGVVVDVKSASTRSYSKFATGSLRTDDPFGYIGQLAGYSCSLGNLDGAFLVIDKTLGNLCLLQIGKEELANYQPQARIASVRGVLAGDVLPERCYEPKPVSKTDKSGNLVLGVGCSYCPFKAECWKDANNGEGLRLFNYASGPKWFVHIEKEPRVDEYKRPPFEPFPVRAL